MPEEAEGESTSFDWTVPCSAKGEWLSLGGWCLISLHMWLAGYLSTAE